MGEAAEPLAVGRMRVVQARVPGLDGVERAVEGGRLDADLADQVLAEVGGEGGGVLRARVREEVVVDQHGDGRFAVHGGGGVREGLGERCRESGGGKRTARQAARRQTRSICLGPEGEIAGSRALACGKGPKAALGWWACSGLFLRVPGGGRCTRKGG